MEEREKRPYKRSRKQNITDQMLMRSLRRMAVGVLLSVFCLISSTWAWFLASADAQVFRIHLPDANIAISSSTWARVRKNQEGEYRMPAGSYTITADPSSGSAAMYCLVHIRTSDGFQERLEAAIENFNEEEETKWRPLAASDSNGIRVLKSDEELEGFLEELEESEDCIYEILPISAAAEGTYRVDWEPEEERYFVLNLEEDAFVSFEIFWLTEEEDDYPGLDEINQYRYVIMYQKDEAVKAETTKAALETKSATGETSAAAEGTTAAVDGTTAAVENTTSGVESTTAAAETTTAVTETTAEETTTATETESGAPTEAATETTAADDPTEPQTTDPTPENPEPTQEQETEAEETDPVLTETQAEDPIPTDMPTDDIENMGENNPTEE